MRIVRASVVNVGGPLPAPVGNAWTSWSERRGLVLRLFDEDGRMGQGEASPLPGYSPDDLESARAALAREPWGAVDPLDEKAPLGPQIRHALEQVDPDVPSARFALETALLDLVGQRLGRPVHDILSGGEPCGSVPVARLLDARDASGAIGAARRALHRGITTLKVKIGRDFVKDVELLAALRAELGDEVALRVDANGTIPPEHVADRLLALATLRPELIEEPVPTDALDALADVPLPVPVALDESLRGAEGERRMSRLVQAGVCRFVILKPTVLGGILHCMELARRARAGGAEAIVTHTFDGPVAMAAAAALAVALPPPRRAAGLDRHGGLRAYSEADAPVLDGGEVVPGEAAGLGVKAVPASR